MVASRFFAESNTEDTLMLSPKKDLQSTKLSSIKYMNAHKYKRIIETIGRLVAWNPHPLQLSPPAR